MEKCLRISGRVQGVGFRFWTIRLVAAVKEVSGYVCNFSDGDVLVLLSGPADKIQTVVQSLYKGPLLARVDSIREAPELKIYFPPIENGVFKRI